MNKKGSWLKTCQVFALASWVLWNSQAVGLCRQTVMPPQILRYGKLLFKEWWQAIITSRTLIFVSQVKCIISGGI